jgi:hypothetical protein
LCLTAGAFLMPNQPPWRFLYFGNAVEPQKRRRMSIKSTLAYIRKEKIKMQLTTKHLEVIKDALGAYGECITNEIGALVGRVRTAEANLQAEKNKNATLSAQLIQEKAKNEKKEKPHENRETETVQEQPKE